ncbi:MAG: UbiA prenyltransferase family protein [Candidatus ainarchaeum sp.]|nr:UbiA prenyltransferase family protein [Candidatus ainarchaeum sp.]
MAKNKIKSKSNKSKIKLVKKTKSEKNLSAKSKIIVKSKEMNIDNLLLEKSKNYSLIQKVLGFVELGRPIEWSKSLLNMFLAVLMVYYVYNFMPLTINSFIFTFLAGFISVAFLWSGLYALNDYTDYKIDFIHATKRNRPIPSGKVLPFQGLIFSIILILTSIIIAVVVLKNTFLLICLLCMIINQLFYTTKPYRLKSRKYFDIISGSMINPIFRYLSGIALFIPLSMFVLATPILPIIFVICLQASGYSLYRLFSKRHDKAIKMQSSVALIPESIVKKISYSILAIGALSYIGLFINGLTLKLDFLGYLPIQYLLPIFFVLIFLFAMPNLRQAIKDPSKADMKSNYRLLYTMNILFVIFNMIIFFFIG